MKKSLVALATLAAATGAFAQTPSSQPLASSSVTIFGGLDARINRLSADNAGSLTRLDNSGEYSSRLGFRGMEDLGGGWGAAFWLEAGIGNDDGRGQNSTANSTNMGQNLSVGTGNTAATAAGAGGTVTGSQLRTPTTSGLNGLQGITFNRASTVSLINRNLGELRVGRDYSPTFWNLTQFDPFGTVGVGSMANVALGTLNPAGASIAPPGTAKPQIRTSNSVGWLSADINGFRIQIQQAFSEVPTNCLGIDTVPAANSTSNSCVSANGDGKLTAFRLTYTNGPLFLGAANSTTKYATSVDPAAFTTSTTLGINGVNGAGNVPFLGDYKVTNYGGSYDLKVVKLFAQMGTQVNGAYSTPYSSTGGIPSTPTITNVAEGKLKYNMLGVTAPMGNWTLKASITNGTRVADASVTNDRKQKQTAVGAVYAMSKRTSLYATYSTMTAEGAGASASQALTSTAATATTNVKATGVDLGISHRF